MKYNKQKHLLAKREATNAFRFLRTPKAGVVDFCSNDYLGLARVREVLAVGEIKGSGGSRLLAGNYDEIESLEDYLSVFHKAESTLIFNSGYNANIGFFSAVPQKGDIVFYDELIHASIKDGMRLSFAKSYSFKHNDINNLKQKLENSEGGGDIYIVAEAVYSMDGDSAPLEDLVSLSNEYNACLVVDEAHSVGVFGEKGEGLVQELGLESQIPIRIITFGKAIGAHGAAILSSQLIKHFLINFSRSFIYTTALPPSSILAIKSSYLALQTGEKTKQITKNITFFRALVSKEKNIIIIESFSSIQCVLVSGNHNVKSFSDCLINKGFDVRAVLSPTVLKGQERLRICLHVFNSEKEIKDLVVELVKVLDCEHIN
jgi:8-amino-7-oxononanoate synthase